MMKDDFEKFVERFKSGKAEPMQNVALVVVCILSLTLFGIALYMYFH